MLIIKVESGPVSDFLRQLSSKVEDMSGTMGTIGMELENRVRARFETRHDPLGQMWKKLADETPATLYQTGAMMAGLSHSHGQDWAAIGFAHDYSAFHEFGTDHMVRRGLLTANPYTGELGPDDEAGIIAILRGALLAD